MWKMGRLKRNEVKMMFIHIGGDTVVRTKDVIAILDVNNKKTKSKKEYNFLDRVENGKEVVKINNVDVKSLVITNDKIYYSPISSLTLKKRSNFYL